MAIGSQGRANLLVLAVQVGGWFILLTAIEHSPHRAVTAGWVTLFCLMMQGVFSMMHEAFHAHAHRSPAVNRAMGVAASTIFCTSYTFFRMVHMGHHVRNRTRAETAEYIYPDDSPALKVFSYYAAVLGGLWLVGLLTSVVLAAIPRSLLRSFGRWHAPNTYLVTLANLDERELVAIRQEVLLLVGFYAIACWSGVWSSGTLLMAYAAFAFSWSSLQWVYHMRTPLDVVEGAYNLRLPRPVRWLFLNFNYNLTHHRDPEIPWQRLHLVSDPRETRPLWYNYLMIFRPPEPLPAVPIMKTYF